VEVKVNGGGGTNLKTTFKPSAYSLVEREKVQASVRILRCVFGACSPTDEIKQISGHSRSPFVDIQLTVNS
jgi:hypothetical protein